MQEASKKQVNLSNDHSYETIICESVAQCKATVYSEDKLLHSQPSSQVP